jgi:simple sugar transport system ATP-binding protein
VTHAEIDTTPAPVIAVSSITKRFGAVLANDGVSLAFYAGEIHVLLGENGAGKSTLIAMLSGMLRPDSGSITVRGKPVAIDSPREAIALGIGTVFQHSTLVPTMTVAENLMLGAKWHAPMRRKATLARLAELSTLLGVSVSPVARAGDLALGQQQQIEIIKALWRGERVLVLDEPTSMLTPQGVRDLGLVLRRLRAEGMAIILITHKLNEVMEFGDRVSILKLGRVVGAIELARLRAMSAEEARGFIVARMFGRAAQDSEVAAEFAGALTLRRQGALAPDMAPILSLAGVSTSSRSREAALTSVSFDVRPGEILGIAGVDGNGQRQLAEVIAGQRALSEGRILLAGEDISRHSVGARQALGLRYLTDDRLGEGTVGGFSVALNSVLKRVGEAPYWQHGWTRDRAIDAHARALIARHDVRTPGPDAPVATLSGGNIQKLLFGRELAMAPRLVIYNKPTYGLDVATIHAARQRIREQADGGVAAVLISTELDELVELCDRVGVMSRGRLVGIVENGLRAAASIGALMVDAVPT